MRTMLAQLGVLLLFLPQFALAAPDECAFIRDGLNALPEVGGEFAVPAGTYTCLAPIVLDRNGIGLRGEGDVTLRLGENVNAPILILGDAKTPPIPLHDIRVSHLKIDGNRWYQKYECWGGPCDGGGNSFIRNNGVTVRAVTRAVLEDVQITGARSGGMVTERGCYDLIADHVSATDDEFDGFAGYETEGARLTSMTLSKNRAAGISLDLRFNGNFFKDIQIVDTGDVGIFMRDSNSNVFEGVTITNSGNHGVFLASAGDDTTCPLGNEFDNLTVIHARGVGLRLNDNCSGNILTGDAHFISNRDGCVEEAPGTHMGVEAQVECKP